MGRERGPEHEHALLGRRAEAGAGGDRSGRPDRRRLQRRARIRRSRQRRGRAGEIHLRVRGRDDPRLDADGSQRLVEAGRRRRRHRRVRRALPRSHARAREAVRDGLPQRPRPRLRLEVAARGQARRVRRSREAGLVRTVRHPGDRRPDLRHVRVPRAGERERCAGRRLRRRVRPRRTAARPRRPHRRAGRAVGRRARAAGIRPLRRRSPRRELRQRPDQRVPARWRRLGSLAAGFP